MSKQANTNLSDLELKDHGNKLFAARKFDDAVACYTKAIVSSRATEFSCCKCN
jgi:STIP1 family protein 1